MFEITGKRHNKLHTALARLAAQSRGWVSLDFFTDQEITALIQLAGVQTFRTAQNEIVYRANRVFQDFDVCFPAPRIGAFDDLAVGLESTLKREVGLHRERDSELQLPGLTCLGTCRTTVGCVF